MSNANQSPIFPVIVAAGVGKRFGSELPKQYTQIHGKTVLEHSVNALTNVKNLQRLRVVISGEDAIAKTLKLSSTVEFIVGGAERQHSVFNAVETIWKTCPRENRNIAWVLIHDAARPCVRAVEIDKLINNVIQSKIGKISGGILAVPMRDTVKQSQLIDEEIISNDTIDRNALWLAQTPQLFPLEALYQYLAKAIEQKIAFTDEASLFEHFDKTPLLIEGSHSNIKLTFPEDILFAQNYLTR